MNNPFQDQLLKAGLVTKKQVQKAKQDKSRKHKQHSKKEKVVDETKIKAQQAAEEKTKRDRELNQRKQEQAKQKAISIEIDQLISSNAIARDESCEVIYNFEHKNKIKRIYLNAEMKQKVIDGKYGIARIEGRYELVARDIAEKIRQRNDKRIVLFTDDKQPDDENDDYSEHQIPDDLMW